MMAARVTRGRRRNVEHLNMLCNRALSIRLFLFCLPVLLCSPWTAGLLKQDLFSTRVLERRAVVLHPHLDAGGKWCLWGSGFMSRSICKTRRVISVTPSGSERIICLVLVDTFKAALIEWAAPNDWIRKELYLQQGPKRAVWSVLSKQLLGRFILCVSKTSDLFRISVIQGGCHIQ